MPNLRTIQVEKVIHPEPAIAFERNQSVNNRGYRPSAHLQVGAELDELSGEILQEVHS